MTPSPKRLTAKRATELSYRSLVENIQDYAIFMLDKNGVVTSWDQGACRQFGYTSKEMIGQNFALLFSHADVVKRVPEADLKSALKNGRHLDEREYQRKDGTCFWSTGVLTSTIDSQQKKQGFSKIMRDISEQKNLQKTVLHSSNHDYLTGLPNRGYFEEHLLKAIHFEKMNAKKNKCLLAIFFLDFDHFKLINDEQGHRVGDLVLIEISARLTKSAAISDLVARLGGDEFIVLIRSCHNVGEIETFAKKILKAFKPVIVVEDKKVQVSASVGIAVYPPDGATASDFLHHADMALYQAKKKGGHQYQFYDDIKGLTPDVGVSRR